MGWLGFRGDFSNAQLEVAISRSKSRITSRLESLVSDTGNISNQRPEQGMIMYLFFGGVSQL